MNSNNLSPRKENKMRRTTSATASPEKSDDEKGRLAGWQRYAVKFRGITPLLMCPMSDATMDGLITGVHAQPNKTLNFRERAAAQVIVDEQDRPAVPVTCLLASIRDAGTLIKFDQYRQVTSGKSGTHMYTFLNVEHPDSEFLPLVDLMPDGEIKKGRNMYPVIDGWHYDKRAGKLANGTACTIIRPCFPKWALDVTLRVNHDLIDLQKVWDLIALAGTGKGLCAGRPSCGMDFGQFEIAGKVKRLAPPKKIVVG
jgi:hypothetical protein